MNADHEGSADARLSFLGEVSADQVDPLAVGSKAAGLFAMADVGLPVPPGFVLGTRVCTDFYERGGQFAPDVAGLIERGIAFIERSAGRRFGSDRRPLLVSVRSGAPVSMPGMLDTLLNIGLCDRTLPGLLRATGDPGFAWDSYRRLIESYAEIAEGQPASAFAAVADRALHRHQVPSVSELDVAALREVVAELLALFRTRTGRDFPQEPREQLNGAVTAVLRSWDSHRAAEYRRIEGLTGLPGTAVTVQAMVFGNVGVASGSGVGFTRDPVTGENRPYIDFLLASQGDDVVAGGQTAPDPEPLIASIPGLARDLRETSRALEGAFGDAQDFEFTVEEGRLWVLQSRDAKRSPLAALRIACDLVDEKVIDRATALDRLSGYDLDEITITRLGEGARPEPIGAGAPASPGVAAGRIALDVETALRQAGRGDPVILVRDQASTDDIAALGVCAGMITSRGARTSHAAVVARQLGVVCVVGCPDLRIDLSAREVRIGGARLAERDEITVDGGEGRIYPGSLELVEERPAELTDRVRSWRGGRQAASERQGAPGDERGGRPGEP